MINAKVIPILLGLSLLAAPALARESGHSKKIEQQFKKVERVVERLENFELPEVESAGDHPSQLVVNADGNVRIINGEVTGVSGSSFTVKIWGLSLAVDASGATFLPRGTTTPTVQNGDRVSIRGRVNGGTGVVSATTVNILTPRSNQANELFERLTKLIMRLRELQARLGLPLTPLPTPPGTPPPPPPPPADTTAPILSSITADNIASTTARVRWTTNENADSKVWYSTVSPVAIASTTPAVFSSLLVTSHEANLSSLTASTTYYYLVVSKDGAGNGATSSQFSFITLP